MRALSKVRNLEQKEVGLIYLVVGIALLNLIFSGKIPQLVLWGWRHPLLGMSHRNKACLSCCYKSKPFCNGFLR
jgi:hypothetical protein